MMQIQDSDLSVNLRYHIRLLTVAANCSLGPKLQAIYPCDDLLRSIADPLTIFPVKQALAEVLLELVETGLESIQYL